MAQPSSAKSLKTTRADMFANSGDDGDLTAASLKRQKVGDSLSIPSMASLSELDDPSTWLSLAVARPPTWPPNTLPAEIFTLIASFLPELDLQNLRLVSREFSNKIPVPPRSRFRWPPDAVPVEIFNLIATHLPRSAIQSMRLVNHEFDNKLSGWYFRNVVARFHPDMYGYLDDECENVVGMVSDSARKDQSIIRNGLRVFSDFGCHIRAFALALELNEADLADPPIKICQQVVKASWGLYRWPLENYARYSDLESLEDTADETERMTTAFAKLTELREIGLCCDAGLGFLTASAPTRRLARVFKSSRYEPETVGERAAASAPSTTTSQGKSARYMNLKRMVLRSGYAEEEAHEAIKLLLECEGRSMNWADIVDDDEADAPQYEGAVAKRSSPTLAALAEARHFRRLYLADLADAPVGGGLFGTDDAAAAAAETARKRSSLEPRNLSPAQEEMLLEMKWALDALMQSYVISVIDNKAVFSNVTIFSIAKISSSLVPVLARWDLWKALISLQEFRLSVVPDWRTLRKCHGGVIDDTKISPLLAYRPVYELLHMFVGQCRTITSLHFEWVCGGEPGHGLAQRNRYILPAPLAGTTAFMSNSSTVMQPSDRLLSLPYIQTLSIKNAWSMPHIFLRAIRKMTESALVHLELESFSLTGPPTVTDQDRITARGTDIGHWPWPLCEGAVPGRMYNRGLGQGWAAIQLQHQQHQAAAQHQQQQQLAAAAAALQNQVQQTIAAATQFAAAANGQNWNGAAPWLQPQPQPAGANAFANNTAAVLNALNLPPAPHNLGTLTGSTPLHVSQPLWSGPIDNTIPVPRILSWAHVLNEITPYQTILDKYAGAAGDDVDVAFRRLASDTATWAGARKTLEKKLATVKFTSCGYVLVDEAHIENVQILPDQPVMCHMVSDSISRLREFDKSMLTSQDTLLGKIVDYIDSNEKNMLHHIFGLDIPGLLTPFDSTMVDPGMVEDGFTMYGTGRFHGVITRGGPVASSATA